MQMQGSQDRQHRPSTSSQSSMRPSTSSRGHSPRPSLVRAERFHRIASCRSLTQAALLMGTSQSLLTHQLQKLEASAGGQLIVRSSKKHEPLRLTALGCKLLSQAVDAFDLPVPHSDPEPLATALRSFRGSERVAKLATAAHEPTLRMAAAACGVKPESLRGSIRGLEASCGPLVGALGVNDPFRLTKRGSLLVEQWRAQGSLSS